VQVELGEQAIAQLSSGAPIELTFAELEPSTSYPLHVTATDASGTRSEIDGVFTTTSALAELSISEVRADPLGSEPAQEFVEVLNYGTTPIDVEGFTLSDAPDALETQLHAASPLAAGARALIVAETFDASNPLDVAPAPGAVLLRTAAALTHNGLANAGEPLFLRDRAGHRLSAAPATPAPRPGVCITRTSTDPRSGAPGSFAYDAAGSCTPGR
jgi:Lamin Tail Domain